MVMLITIPYARSLPLAVGKARYREQNLGEGILGLDLVGDFSVDSQAH